MRQTNRTRNASSGRAGGGVFCVHVCSVGIAQLRLGLFERVLYLRSEKMATRVRVCGCSCVSLRCPHPIELKNKSSRARARVEEVRTDGRSNERAARPYVEIYIR